jgi:hypothetical protein
MPSTPPVIASFCFSSLPSAFFLRVVICGSILNVLHEGMVQTLNQLIILPEVRQ